MEPQMKEEDKRLVAAFVPYYRDGKEYRFFLQKRTADAPTNPGMFGMFGGGVEEGETPEEAFFREVEEELVYKPQKSSYFSRYENAHRIFHVFIEEVESDFESKVDVLEGDYGRFLSISEVSKLPNLTHLTRLIVAQVEEMLLKNNK
jgi:8-oxo-dGTP pyrophosphatase MutT (NUDIX family)